MTVETFKIDTFSCFSRVRSTKSKIGQDSFSTPITYLISRWLDEVYRCDWMGPSRNKVYIFLDSMEFEFFKIKIFSKFFLGIMFHVNPTQDDYIKCTYPIIPFEIDPSICSLWKKVLHLLSVDPSRLTVKSIMHTILL